MHEYPSGEQWVIAHGGQEVTVVEVGGGLREYRRGGVDVLAGYAVDEQCRAGRGQLLMPWPNRLRDGRYTFDGVEYQLGLSDPSHGNASHGLARWVSWSLVERSEAGLTVGCRLHPQPGWPGVLDLSANYVLTARGWRAADATNIGDTLAPSASARTPTSRSGTTRWARPC